MSDLKNYAWLVAAGVITNACGGGSPSTPVAPVVAAETAANYEVHEWGLIRTDANDVWTVGALGDPTPARRTEPLIVDKPVLYFHLMDPAAGPITLSRVGVTAVAGEIREHWPLVSAFGSSHPTTLAWQNVTIRSGQCAASSLPTPSTAPCTGLMRGEFCESPLLASVRAAGATCVTTTNGTDSFLFYRSSNGTFSPPVSASRSRNDDIALVHRGTLPIPGLVFRMHTDQSGVHVATAAPPAPHQTSTLTPNYVSTEIARNTLRTQLVELGLDTAEANAFIASWDSAFFGDAAVVDALTVDGDFDEMDRRGPAQGDSVLYFLPESAIENVSTLSFSPAPRAVHRVMAVWMRIN